MEIFVLWAHRTDYPHKFSELFTTRENLDKYIENHPEIEKDEITLHELDPK